MFKIRLVYNNPKEMTEEQIVLDPRSYRQNEIIAHDIKKAFESSQYMFCEQLLEPYSI